MKGSVRAVHSRRRLVAILPVGTPLAPTTTAANRRRGRALPTASYLTHTAANHACCCRVLPNRGVLTAIKRSQRLVIAERRESAGTSVSRIRVPIGCERRRVMHPGTEIWRRPVTLGAWWRGLKDNGFAAAFC